jgi:hypothetical protein
LRYVPELQLQLEEIGAMRTTRIVSLLAAIALAFAGAAFGAPRPAPRQTPVARQPPAIQKASALFPACDDFRWGYIDKTGKVVSSGYEEASDFSEGLAPVKKDGRYGYVDAAGKMVIPARYDDAGRFSDGLAAVRVGDLCGYVDKTGNSVIKPQYTWATWFSGGLAVVKIDGKFGAIDRTGAITIQPGFQDMGYMSEEFIAVEQDGKWGFAGKTGTVVISPQFDRVDKFSNGLAPAWSGNKCGFIDTTGKWVIEPKYREALPFSEGLAAVAVEKQDMVRDANGRVVSMKRYNLWGYIDITGKEVIPLELMNVGSFSEGMASGWKDGQFVFIDKTGKIALAPIYNSKTGGFHNGLARTQIGARCGYINEAGAMVIPQLYAGGCPFYEGLAAVQPLADGAWGFIDTAGHMAIKPQFGAVLGFQKGLARVRVDWKWGIIDKTGKVVLEPKFDNIGRYTDKVLAANMRDNWGFFDWTGQVVVEPQFASASFLGDGQTIVIRDGKYGVVDTAGKMVVPTQYNDAGWLFSNGLLPVSKDGKWGFIDATGKMVIEPQYDSTGGFTPDGLCAVKVGEKWGFIDPTGEMAISAQYDAAVCFSEGLAAVKAGDRWGFTDKTGKAVIKPQYALAGSFSGGLASVQIGEKWGYVDKTGKLVIPVKYDKALDFDNGLAQIRLGNQTGYVNATGKAVWMSRLYTTASVTTPPPAKSRVAFDSDGMRVLKVKVAADQVLRQTDGWQSILEKRMQAVSDIMEKDFKIRIAVTSIVPWTTPEFKDSDDPDEYGYTIYDALGEQVPLDDAEIEIGFTGRDSRSTTLAFTHVYYDRVIVYDPYKGAEETEARIPRTIAHEICHDFGAFHVPEETSIMNAILYEGDQQTTFDGATTHQVDLMRDYDFGKGIDSLSADKIKQAAAIYAGGHAPHVPFPVAKAYMFRGVRRPKDDIAGAIRDYRQAIETDGQEPDLAHVYRLGRTLLNDGQTVLGIETLRKCRSLKTDPEDAGMYHNFLADSFANQLKSDVDFISCQQAARPRLGEILQRYILTRMSPDEVISEYKEAIAAKPQEANYHSKLAETLVTCGRLDEAVAEYEKAVALESSNSYFYIRLGLLKAQAAQSHKTP